MKLVIVESPTKAKTISRFLGHNYNVMSSFGHVRDLPAKELGVDIEHDFKPKYVIIPKTKKHLSDLQESAQKAEYIILATDEDREGEAIAWHLVQALDLNEGKRQKVKSKGVERIVFHEITKRAIEEALKNPRDVDLNLVDAQQARRILDRLVGYKLSPFLWKKVVKGLSAGRVQSVAVRLIVEREREIENFVSEEYWSIEALLRQITNHKSSIPRSRATAEDGQFTNKSQIQNSKSQNKFTAKLVKIGGETIPKLGIKNKEEADKIMEDLEGAEYRVENIEKKEIGKYPLAPYITSTLQQDAWRRLRFSTKLTMRIAQQLYEGINLGKGPVGLITYMRTDSVNLSKNCQYTAKEFIESKYGPEYHSWRTFKTKSRLAQEAHEAIRPTDPKRTPESIKEHLDQRQYKLYELIWRRFIACQMSPARFDSTIINIKAKTCNLKPKIYIFRATGQILKFNGFLRVYPIKFEENELPELTKDEILELIKLTPEQHFTQPSSRYSEATLVKALEKEGIGRPSTYAPIMSTIQDRGYIEKDEKKYFKPTEIGILVNDLLVEHFPKIVDIKFTAHMEEDLDEIAQGKVKWVPVIREFYGPFEKNLEEKYQEVEKQDLTEETEEVCEKCGKPMVIKLGKFGKFIACSGFPECKNTKPLEKSTKVTCSKCNQGEIIERKTKKRKLFYSCNRWPECDFALWYKPTGERCPECNSLLVEDRSKIKCSDKNCKYVKT